MYMRSREIGVWGEDVSLNYLQKKGYSLLERNYRFGHKEIDLILQDEDIIVFVEVKTRSTAQFGSPAESITDTKRHNLIVAAEAYMIKNQLFNHPARFDVIEIDLSKRTIHHILNAFEG